MDNNLCISNNLWEAILNLASNNQDSSNQDSSNQGSNNPQAIKCHLASSQANNTLLNSINSILQQAIDEYKTINS